MPFKKIPNIIGPNYGGFIHGVSLRRGFDASNSQLVLSIINESGSYVTPQLFQNQTVTIGSLKFNGFVSSWRKNESIGRRTLEVTLEDYSSVLDKINVILYKRNIPGTSTVTKINKTKTKTVEKVVTKVITVTGLTSTPLISISFEKVTKNVTVGPRECYSGRGSSYTLQNGGYIIIGEEEYTSNSCSLADSSYTFNELLSLLSFANSISGFNDNPNYRASYEGSLRSVLQSWCADYGLGFYWDFNKNKLVFIDLTSEINDIPDIDDCDIINKTESQSTDGTFSQASMYYYMKEGAAPEQANFTVTAYSPIKLEPIYANDVGITNEDIVSGVLANFHDGLRKYYDIYIRNLLPSVGITQVFGTFGFDYLRNKSFDATQIAHLERLSPGGNFLVCYYDEAVSTSYSSRMADLVANFIGKYYRINMNPQQTQVACSSSAYTRIETLVTPAPTTFNNLNGINSGNFPLFERSGSFNITQFDFNNLFQNIGDITSFMIQPINLRNSPAFSQIISDFKLPLNASALSKVSIIFIAHAGIVNSAFGGISISYAGYSINNTESLATNSFGGSGNNAPCTFASICKDETTEEEASFYAQINDPFVVRPNVIGGAAIPPKQGLLNREGHAVDITIGGRSLRIVTPAEAPYTGYVSQTLETTNLISGTGSEKSLVWRGDLPVGESNVKEVRFALNNITSDLLDKQIVTLSGISVIPKQKNTKGIKTITYNCCDFIDDLPIDPSRGLESFDVSIEGDALSVDYVYSTKPKTYPKLETTLRQTDSRINRSGFRHRK